jgi:hypothetical protein
MSKYPGNIITTGADAGYSVFFPGSGSSYVVMTNASAAINPTTSTTPFTIECWVYTNGTTTTTLYAALASENYGFTLGFGGSVGTYDSNQTPWFGNYTGAWNGIRSTTPVAFRTWTHIACVFTGSTCFIYQNGVLTASGGPTTWGVTGSSKVRIGCRPDATTDVFTGYIAGARVVIGSNLYPGGTTFTPPTVPLNVTNTQLLVCNSPNIVDQSNNAFPLTISGTATASTFSPYAGYQAYNPALGAATPGIWSLSDALQAASTRQWNMYDPYFNYTTLKLSGNPVTNVPTWITDASTNNYAITVNGDARAAGLSPFSLTTYPNSGSGYFDGTSDYLVTTTNLPAISGEATFECWVYPTTSGVGTIYATGTATQFTVYRTSGNGLGVQSGTTAYIESAGSLLPTNTWTHIAVTKNATNTFVMYVNGAVASAATSSGTMSSTYAAGVGYIGCAFNISNLRFVNGLRVYTGAFTTPTAPLTATQPAGTNISAITGTSTSLLTLQNSQSSNNNSFLDSSSNNFLITRNGNTTQGTFTPFTQTGWSNYFNGSSSYLSSTIAAPGTGDFTYEFWVYAVEHVALSGEWGAFQTSTTSGGLSTSYTTGVMLARLSVGGVFSLNVAGTAYNSSVVVQLNTFYHIAIVRNSGTISMYVNGVNSITSGTNTTNITATNVAIGGYYSTSYVMKGYISNFRATNAALYTSSFTPPTSPLTSSNASTTLLTCQSNRFIDTNTQAAAKTITVNGTPSVQAFSPFQTNVAYTPATRGGSAYFDGTGDILSTLDNAAFTFGSGDFTVEGWVYATTSSARRFLVMQTSSTATAASTSFLIEIDASNQLNSGVYSSTTGYLTTKSITVNANAWNHFALVRNGNTLSSYVNGALNGTVSVTGVTVNDSVEDVKLGNYATSGGLPLVGYLSSVRITKGVAVYTGAFTPPIAPLSTSGAASASAYSSTTNVNTTFAASSCSLLTNFTNAGIVDTTGKNVLETVGDARISTTVSKFGGSSMFFDGTGDYLNIPSSPILAFGTGAYTIEFWINPSSLSATASHIIGANATNGILVLATNARLALNKYNVGDVLAYNTALTTSTWAHVAIVREGTGTNQTKIYVNGANVVTGTDSNDWTVTSFFGLGANTTNGTQALTGYLSDVRVTRGVARYIGNFTPPTSLLQNQ